MFEYTKKKVDEAKNRGVTPTKQKNYIKMIKRETYNTGYSLVVTDPTTNPALARLSWEIRRDPDLSGGCGRMCLGEDVNLLMSFATMESR